MTKMCLPIFIYNGPFEFDGDKTAQSHHIDFRGFGRVWLQQGGIGHGIWHGNNDVLNPTNTKGTICARFVVETTGRNGWKLTEHVATDFERYWLLSTHDSLANKSILSDTDSKLFRRIMRRTLE